MSVDNVKRFFEAVAEDQTLRQKFAGREPAEAARIAVQVGSERGLQFTAEELLQVVGGTSGRESGEVGDKELEGVAGGSTSMSPSQFAQKEFDLGLEIWKNVLASLSGEQKAKMST